jgi:hypothetical protein
LHLWCLLASNQKYREIGIIIYQEENSICSYLDRFCTSWITEWELALKPHSLCLTPHFWFNFENSSPSSSLNEWTNNETSFISHCFLSQSNWWVVQNHIGPRCGQYLNLFGLLFLLEVVIHLHENFWGSLDSTEIVIS